MNKLRPPLCLLLLSLLLLAVPARAQEEGDAPAQKGKRVRPRPLRAPAAGLQGGQVAVPPAAPVVAAPPPAPAAGQPPPAPGAPPPADKPPDLPLPGEKEFTECRRIPPGQKMVVNLKPDSELQDLVGWIKSISCRPFIVPSNVRQAKVTVIVPERITANEAYRIFLSALESMGLTVQPYGNVLKIIESNRARESPIPVVTPGQRVPQTEQFVTRMLRLHHVLPEDVVQVLNRLKSPNGDISPYAPTNTLIITDLTSNIRRMEEVVRALDVPMGSEKIWVIRLKNVVASEVAQMLQQIFGVGKAAPGGGQPQQRRPPVAVPAPAGADAGAAAAAQAAEGDLSISQIFPDERTNSLILVATEKTYLRVLALIRRLEQQGGELGTGGGRVHVYALENANAEDMGQVLQGLGVSVSAAGGRRAGQRGGVAPPPQPGQPGQAGGVFQDEVKITADKATNSLIIVANPQDYLTLRNLIQRLDVPRRQVFIEATIMEINLSKRRDLGISYHGGYPLPDNQGLVLGGLSNNNLQSFNPLSIATLQGLAAGAFGTPLNTATLLGTTGAGATPIPSFGVLINALASSSDANVLQVPNILTTDNEKATIQVGQNVPFPATNFGLPGFGAAPPGGGAAGFAVGTSVQRQDVALKLDVTPHVNASDFVRLEIDHEISDIAGEVPNLGPITNKRTLKTVAVVRDQQPVVLGGILRDSVTESVSKIPLLGDIPILGYLFKIKRKQVNKLMLIIVLTPYVIHEPSDLRRIFDRKMKERREFIETYSAFASERDFDKVVDYSRKRGALEEINRTLIEAEREALEIRAAEAGLRYEIEAGPVELPAPPARGAAPAAPAPPPSVAAPPPAPAAAPGPRILAPPPPAPAPVR